MRNALLLLAVTALFVVGFLAVPSCLTPRDVVHNEAIREAAALVIARHDAYVRADVSLDVGRRGAALGDSLDASHLLSLETAPRAALAVSLGPIVDRHDAYVIVDGALDPLARETYLTSSAVLRRVLTPND